MRSDFAAFILTHGRPDRVHTLRSLKRSGYTGRVFLVVDDEDDTLPEYRRLYGEQVLTFSKAEAVLSFDEGDNFNDRRAIIYARNACFDLAEQVGARYFIQLDDDYVDWSYAIDPNNRYLSACPTTYQLDAIFEALVEFLASVPYVATVAVAQNGDFMGGPSSGVYKRALSRKAMNTFICDTQRRFYFHGRVNEDVNTYTSQTRSGLVMLTYPRIRVQQKQTQSNAGGMTEMYLDAGTYVKSFYTVMYAPSCMTIRMLAYVNARLHHFVKWEHTAPKILHERHRKP